MEAVRDDNLSRLIEGLELSFFIDSSKGNWQSPVIKVQDEQGKERVLGDLRSIDLYKKEVAKIPLLTEKATRDLSSVVQREKPKAGEQPSWNFIEARNELVEHNLQLGLWFSEQYWYNANGVIGIEDIVQECNKGLMLAAESYDATKGTKFSTYAFKCLISSVQRAFASSRFAMRVPEYYPQIAAQLRSIQQELLQTTGEQPALEDIVRVRNRRYRESLTVDLAQQILRSTQEVKSLQSPTMVEPGIDDEDAEYDELVDTLTDEELVAEERTAFGLMKEDLTAALSGLDDRERRVIEYRFGLGDDKPMTLMQTGKKLGISGERVRKIECKAIRKINRSPKARRMEGYMDDIPRYGRDSSYL